mgnify:CR=1 FL=1
MEERINYLERRIEELPVSTAMRIAKILEVDWWELYEEKI